MSMKPMLAGQYVPAKVEGQLPVYGQPKLDGIRMFIRDGVAWTRSLKEVRSEQVQAQVREHAHLLEGLDGEVIAGDPTAEDCYRRTSSSVMSFDKPDDVKFHIFDIWNSDDDYSHRYRQLRELFFSKGLPDWCELVEIRMLKTMEELAAYEAELLAAGHEGMILRGLQTKYKFGRGTPTKGELIKVKQFADTEAVVTDLHEFMHNSNEATINELGHMERSSHQDGLVPMDTLGKVEARGFFPDGTSYTVKIGTGFTMEQRQEIWDNRDDYIGRLVKFKYFPTGVKEAPRFPVFLGFRDKLDTSPPLEEDNEPSQGELF